MDAAAPIGTQCNGGYRIELYPQDQRQHSYDIVLTREEMLGVTASWLAAEARTAKDAEKQRARQQKEAGK